MPTLAEQLVGSVAGSTQDFTKNVTAGANLAQGIEQAQQNRALLEQKKQELQNQKVEKLMGSYENVLKIKSPAARRTYLNNYLPRVEAALGLEGLLSQDVKEMIKADPDQVKKIQGLVRKVRTGELTKEDAFASVADLETFMQLEDYDEQFAIAEELANKQRDKNESIRLMGAVGLGKQVQAQEAAPRVEAGKKIADIHSAFVASGGKSNVQSNLAKLQDALKKLESGEVETGGISGVTLGNYPRLLAATNPDLKALMDDIRGAINLRATLADPNPTELQVNAILSRAIDPALPTDKNVKKLKDMISELTNEVTNKQGEFIKRGLLTAEEAWKPAGRKSFKTLSPTAQSIVIKKRASDLGLTENEAKKQLESE